MGTLSDLQKNRLTENILALYKQRLTAKELAILPPTGVGYTVPPSHLCQIGNVGPLRNPDYDGPQPPSSMGTVLLVTPDQNNEIKCLVSGRFDVTHRYIPDLSKMLADLLMDGGTPRPQQTISQYFRRYTVNFEDIPFVFHVPSELSIWKQDDSIQSTVLPNLNAQLLTDPRVYRRCQLTPRGQARMTFDWSPAISTQDDLNAAIARDIYEAGSSDVLPYQVSLRARLRVPPASLTSVPNALLLELYLVNATSTDVAWLFGLRQPFLLDCELTTHIAAGDPHLLPHKLKPEDYRYVENDGLDGYGVNCAVRKIGAESFQTESMPVIPQWHYETPSPGNVGMTLEPSFYQLSTDPLPVLDDLITALEDYAGNWVDKIADLTAAGQLAEAEVAKKDAAEFSSEIDRIKAGRRLLESHPDLLRAFCWMNETMQCAVKRQKKSFTGWRLFQLGFILTQIEAIHERHEPPSLERQSYDFSDVLWFSTGGGKTEAYLGIICIAMFYERMRGRTYGTTAWLRFPLRMLSVQQFQRLSFVVAQANIFRQERGLGGHPFTIGYFTGGGTPSMISRTGEYYQKFFLPNLSRPALDSLQFIGDCPYCDAEHSVKVVGDIPTFRIKHVCSNVQCWTNTTADSGQYGEGIEGELGIYVSDEECYRYLPTVLVGTIDKLAVIAHNMRFSKFFGSGKYFCPEHGFTKGTICEHSRPTTLPSGEVTSQPCRNNTRTSQLKTVAVADMVNPGFSFCIQDELHLLKETLGNFDGHYETLLQTLQTRFGGPPPKTLAATATIKDFAHHIHHLYQKEAVRFPAAGISQGESFYTRQKFAPDGTPLVRRYFTGFLPIGQRNPDVRGTGFASSVFLDLVDELRDHFQNQPAQAATQFGLNPGDVAAALDHIETHINTNLIYVNRKRAISEIGHYLEEANAERGATRQWTRLDGESTLEQIQEAIDHVEQKKPNDPLRQLIATSVVSHGVDIERLNFMILSGWATSTAEYIQSSARSGRVHPGIVVTVLSYLKLFEHNVYLNFADYHTFLDKMIESVPINRFAPNVLERTLPGIMSAVILNWASCQPWGGNIKNGIREIHQILNDSSSPGRQEIERVAIEALSIDPAHAKAWFDPRVIKEFDQHVANEVRRGLDRLASWSGGAMDMNLTDVLGRIYSYNPLRSFRDIENQIGIQPVNGSRENLIDALGR